MKNRRASPAVCCWLCKGFSGFQLPHDECSQADKRALRFHSVLFLNKRDASHKVSGAIHNTQEETFCTLKSCSWMWVVILLSLPMREKVKGIVLCISFNLFIQHTSEASHMRVHDLLKEYTFTNGPKKWFHYIQAFSFFQLKKFNSSLTQTFCEKNLMLRVVWSLRNRAGVVLNTSRKQGTPGYFFDKRLSHYAGYVSISRSLYKILYSNGDGDQVIFDIMYSSGKNPAELSVLFFDGLTFSFSHTI